MYNRPIRVHMNAWKTMQAGHREIYALAKHFHATGKSQTGDALVNTGKVIKASTKVTAPSSENE